MGFNPILNGFGRIMEGLTQGTLKDRPSHTDFMDLKVGREGQELGGNHLQQGDKGEDNFNFVTFLCIFINLT